MPRKPLSDFEKELVEKSKLSQVLAKLAVEPDLTTKELELRCQKQFPTATFYKLFKKAKDGGYIASKTNQKHDVIWGVTERGHNLFRELIALAAKKEVKNNPERYISFLEKLKKLSGKLIEWEYFEKNGLSGDLIALALVIQTKPVILKAEIRKNNIEKAIQEIKKIAQI